MVTTSKSINLTARTATPFNVTNSRLQGGVVKCVVDTIENPNSGAGDIAMFGGISVDATLLRIDLASDDAGTTGTFDIGFYKLNNDGTFTVVDVDNIGNDIDNSGAAISLTNYRFSAPNISTVQAPLWSLAGLSARPDYAELFFGLTMDGNDSSIATISTQVYYME